MQENSLHRFFALLQQTIFNLLWIFGYFSRNETNLLQSFWQRPCGVRKAEQQNYVGESSQSTNQLSAIRQKGVRTKSIKGSMQEFKMEQIAVREEKLKAYYTFCQLLLPTTLTMPGLIAERFEWVLLCLEAIVFFWCSMRAAFNFARLCVFIFPPCKRRTLVLLSTDTYFWSTFSVIELM